ncbi:MAG: hypothetical protein KZQ73_08040 [Candidatus Thiodiazotropha sp. (ex Semelilucina semeliformis)]|nr:hypothetical protein [Candidatus Thiodiazotropha sp. (ex Semelilucina semeliformis)]
MKPALKFGACIVVALVVFVSGIIVGNSYQITDLLCPGTASPYLLDEDFVTDDGILFPKGTLIPLRHCAYMQRFKWHFAIDNSVQLNQAESQNGHDYGFSELSKKVQ